MPGSGAEMQTPTRRQSVIITEFTGIIRSHKKTTKMTVKMAMFKRFEQVTRFLPGRDVMVGQVNARYHGIPRASLCR